MWKIKSLSQMTSNEFYQCLKLRIDTFVVEQSRIYPELDDDDLHALHVYHLNDQNQVYAYARVFLVDDHIVFGRVVVAKSARHTGLATALMHHIIEACRQLGSKPIVILAQEQVVGYYKHFGFKTSGEPFIHESTPHVKMILEDY